MPWPVYLALKHLFPTGPRGALAREALLDWKVNLPLMLVLGLVLKLINSPWTYVIVLPLALVGLLRVTIAVSSFFSAMSLLGVTLGVMALVMVTSVMNGFRHEYELNLIRAQGHISIRSGQAIENPGEIVRLAESVPGVTFAEPYALGVVMLIFESRPFFPAVRTLAWPPQFPRTDEERASAPPADTAFSQVRSIDVNRAGKIEHPLAKTVVFGSADDLDDNSVLLGRGLAADLGAVVGDTIEVYTPLMLDRMKNDTVLLPRELRVAGIYETGWVVADGSTIAVTLRTMQELYGFGDQAHGIEVRIDSDDYARVREVAAALEEKLAALNAARTALAPSPAEAPAPLHARTWLETNADLMKILLVEKMVIALFLVIIVFVAAFSIASSLMTAVTRKTREIGVLGALGAWPGQIAGVFCLQGLLIGVVGSAMGVAAGLVVLHFRQGIVDAVIGREAQLDFYKFLSFPVQYHARDFIVILSLTLVVTTAAGLLPAWRAARMKPADCLRAD